MCFSFLRPAFLSERVEAEGKNVCVLLDTRACYLVQALRTIGHPSLARGLTGTVLYVEGSVVDVSLCAATAPTDHWPAESSLQTMSPI
jgi:hypothetical protein